MKFLFFFGKKVKFFVKKYEIFYFFTEKVVKILFFVKKSYKNRKFLFFLRKKVKKLVFFSVKNENF